MHREILNRWLFEHCQLDGKWRGKEAKKTFCIESSRTYSNNTNKFNRSNFLVNIEVICAGIGVQDGHR